MGPGKPWACAPPSPRQLLGWQAQDPERRIAALVLEVKGDFCHQVRGILADAGRAGDCIGLGDDDLDSYSLAYTIASLINQLFGRSKEPFWQQAYVNLVRWIIELHWMSPQPWVTLQDVYRAALDAELVKRRIAEVEAAIASPAAVRVRTADLSGRMAAVKGWDWEPAGDGAVRAKDDPKLREQLKAAGIAFDVVRLGAADPERRERLAAVKRWHEQDWQAVDQEPGPRIIRGPRGFFLRFAPPGPGERLAAVKRWHEQDWQALDQKLRSSIIEGLSVFLSVFDLPDVARVFCPSAPPAPPPSPPPPPPPPPTGPPPSPPSMSSGPCRRSTR